MVGRRAVVTGIGVASPIGNDPATFLAALREGRGGIAPVRAFDTAPFRSRMAGEVRDFDPARLGALADAWPDRCHLLALSAALDAVRGAGLPPDLGGDRRAAVVVGTCNGGLRTAEALTRHDLGDPAGAPLDPARADLATFGSLARCIAAACGAGGPSLVVTTACASSTNAFGIALDLIRTGRVDVVLAGGADSLAETVFAGFSALKAMAAGACRPFSGDPSDWGMTLAEGAAFWVVESGEHARARGAAVLGEVLGYGLSGDAWHATAPEPTGDGPFRAMRAACEDAGIDPATLGAVNAHGTGTEANDRAEAKALTRLLGDAVARIPVSSTKSFVGHALGAAGALEATAALLAMRAGFVPPTLGFDHPRPIPPLDHVPNVPRPARYDTVLSENLAFAGNNAAVVLGAPDVDRPFRRRPARAVVLSGAGAVSPCGIGVAGLRDALAPDPLTAGSRGAPAPRPVPPFDFRAVDRRLDLRSMTPAGRFATLAAREALESAGFPFRPKSLEAVGLVLGLHVGTSQEVFMHRVWSDPARVPDVAGFTESVPNQVSGHVSRALYLKGHATTLAPGPQAGLAALAAAADAVAIGHADTVVAAAADELFHDYTDGYARLGWLARGDEAPDRPLPGLRRVPGEGASAVVLETAEAAAARGAVPLARVLGWAQSVHPAGPGGATDDGDGLAWAVGEALSRARVAPSDVAAVLTAPAGCDGDARETAALDRTLPGVPRLSTVPATGLLESAGALAALAAWAAGAGPRGVVVAIGTSPTGTNHVAVLAAWTPSLPEVP